MTCLQGIHQFNQQIENIYIQILNIVSNVVYIYNLSLLIVIKLL